MHATEQTIRQESQSSKTQVLTKALFNVKQELGLSNETIGHIIGADAATISRMHKKMDMKQSKMFEASVLLVRCYRSLFSILGGSQEAMKHWLKSNNKDFEGDAPINKMKSLVGLVNTTQYLDAMRGRI